MTDLKDTPEETDSTSSIVCPWCFHKHRAPGMDTVYWEISPEECSSCGKLFKVRVELTFHAKPVMEDKP